MAHSVDELTCEWKDDEGRVITEQLDKIVLTKGAWATVMYLYRDLNRGTGEYGKPKARIQRYQKRGGRYSPHSKFNFSSLDQAKQVAEILMGWVHQRTE